MDRSKFDELMKKSQKAVESAVKEAETQFKDALGARESLSVERGGTGMQYGFDVVEVQRVGLKPGDVLMVTVKNDDLDQVSVDALRTQLQLIFPNNKVFVFAMGTCDDVQLSVVSPESPLAIKTNPSYLDKGEEDAHMKELAKQAGEQS